MALQYAHKAGIAAELNRHMHVQFFDLGGYRTDRIMYGSNFSNIAYAWDRELKTPAAAGPDGQALEQITYRNAMEFFSIPGIDGI